MTPAEEHLAEAVEHYEASQTKAEIAKWLTGLIALNIRPTREAA